MITPEDSGWTDTQGNWHSFLNSAPPHQFGELEESDAVNRWRDLALWAKAPPETQAVVEGVCETSSYPSNDSGAK